MTARNRAPGSGLRPTHPHGGIGHLPGFLPYGARCPVPGAPP